MRWIRSSPQLVKTFETRLLNRLKSRLQSFFVPVLDGTSFLRTIIADNRLNEVNYNGTQPSPCDTSPDEPIPIVLMHGFASGLALWCKNIDSLASTRKVYAIDVIGFGRSSRPRFPTDAAAAEDLFVDSFEDWRSALKLEKFILVAHSLGGYISSVYAIRYPQRISHLILIDPWGILEAPFDEEKWLQNSKRPWLLRTVRNMLRNSNPLTALRVSGLMGRNILHFVRQDLRSVFDQQDMILGQEYEVEYEEGLAREDTSDAPNTDSTVGVMADSVDVDEKIVKGAEAKLHKTIDLSDYDGSVALDYVYHINVQKPSGEVGFKSLCGHIGWARRPIFNRLDELDPSVPISFVFGSRSWMDMSSGEVTRAKRPESYVDIKVIDGAGHQVYAQAADDFNAYVNEICQRVDQRDPFTVRSPSESFVPIQTPPDSPSTPRRTRSSTGSSRLQSLFFPAERGASPKRPRPSRVTHEEESSQ